MEFTGITFAGKGQNLDTGAKVVHVFRREYLLLYQYAFHLEGRLGISTFSSL